MSSQPQERRRAPRVEERLPLTIVAPAHELAAATRNLSSSGAYCDLDHPISPMTKVALTIELPQRRIRCRGVVVRSDMVEGHSGVSAAHHRIAIFFTHLHARDRQAIAQFVAQRLARHGDTPASHLGPRSQRLIGLIAALAALGVFGGCATTATLAVTRGPRTTQIVDALGTTAEEGKTYTFRWLQRRFVDFYSQLRFDGLVVDLQGRHMQALRRHDGDHVLLLSAHTPSSANASALPPSPDALRAKQLTIAAKDLPTLQAVVRRYRFEPYLITDAAGVPQAVIYAPVPMRITVTSLFRGTAMEVDVQRITGQSDAVTRQLSAGSLGGSAF